MACALEFRNPSVEVRRLWNELRVLNDTLGTSVKSAEEYLRNLDTQVRATKGYFADIKSRISAIPKGQVVISKELEQFLQMPAESAQQHFLSMRSEAAEKHARVTLERGTWLAGATELMQKQMGVLDRIDALTLQLNETRGLRIRLLSTYRDIVAVEEEVKSLQKVLFECEVGKAELEEDYVQLIKTFEELKSQLKGDAVES